jgi:hypothetical protein
MLLLNAEFDLGQAPFLETLGMLVVVSNGDVMLVGEWIVDVSRDGLTCGLGFSEGFDSESLGS